ncbi:MAG: glycosyltransferase family 2 protein [Methanobacterium sp.]|nr:glycosyltransferase family 2 protein [Methanobacterium sp.]
MNETVCAIVVTYNRKELLLECLDGLKRQDPPLDAIYLIDNASIDDTPRLLFNNGYIKELPPENLNENLEITSEILNLINEKEIKIHNVRMYENKGGAGGFYEGIKRAFQKGYNWLWLMDDDSEPRNDALEKLVKHFNNEVYALACVVKNEEDIINRNTRGYFNPKLVHPLNIPLNPEEYSKEISEIEFASFVGLMINKKIVEQIGYPKKELFIYYDDIEYCIRLREKTKILLVCSSIILHKDAYINERKIKRGQINYNNLWISYYDIRNRVWIQNRYHKNKIYSYFSIIKLYLNSLVGIVLFGDNKFKRIHFTTEAYLDGLKGIFDNDKPKRILYKRGV